MPQHFLQCMSNRGAEMMREDMDAAGPVKIRDVEGAQQQILAVVGQLENEGAVSLKGGGGDQYVVKFCPAASRRPRSSGASSTQQAKTKPEITAPNSSALSIRCAAKLTPRAS